MIEQILKDVYASDTDYPTADGTCERDYIHVADVAKGHVSALEYAFDKGGFEIVNLGTGKVYSVLEAVNTFMRVNNVEIPYMFAPRRKGDIPVSFADTEKARRILGWEAEKSIEDMCRDSFR